MSRLFGNCSFWLTVWLMVCLTVPGLAQTTIFHYRVNDSDDAGLPVVPSVGGEDGIAGPDVELSSDIPTVGVPADAGNRSLFGGGLDGINSADIVELDNGLISDAGGFTYETWFNWDGFGDINSIIDYAGTEKLVIDVNAGAGNELRMRINSNGGLDSFIAEVEPETWYYSAVVFDTQGNDLAEDLSITGVFHLYLDGELLDTTDEVTITEFGDSLGRTIGISKHPLGFARDFFNGLVYEPRVSLGALTAGQLLYQGTGGLLGDFDGSGLLDAADIEILSDAVRTGSMDSHYDLDESGVVDADDRIYWVEGLANTYLGDSNLDGEFSSSDFVQVFTAGEYEDATALNSTWSEGDWNGDGDFDSSDFVAAFTAGGYELGPRVGVSAVPEPSAAMGMLMLVTLAIGILRRHLV
ncbi:MAG: LamG domain-containing protein [Planctomycetales bacterium]|nr:LamG domain-containing protein [Planctomycetales bacterium]